MEEYRLITMLGAGLQALSHGRNEGLAALQAESLLRAVLLGEKIFKGHGLHDVLPDPLAMVRLEIPRARDLELVAQPFQLIKFQALKSPIQIFPPT